MKSGFAAIVGRPNVGKSSILNAVLDKKIAITSSTSNTTRNNIQGIYTKDDIQIIFVDTPGIHKPKQHLGKVLNKQAYNSMLDVDVILFVVDASEDLGKGDTFVIEKLKTMDKPVILLLNKIDKLKRDEIFNKIVEYKDLYDFAEIIPISARSKKNIDTMINVITNYLPDDVQYYDEKYITNVTREFVISEIVREKVIELTSQEVPHSVTCVVEKLEDFDDKLITTVLIVVDRDSLKRIIIGKSGQMIKNIGMRARANLEHEYGKKVYLELYVKTVKNWREKENLLIDLGIIDSE